MCTDLGGYGVHSSCVCVHMGSCISICAYTLIRVPGPVGVLQAPGICACVCSIHAWCARSLVCRFLCVHVCVVCVHMSDDSIF